MVGKGNGKWVRRGTILFHAAAIALMLALPVPGNAADERAVKSRVSPVYPEIAKRMHITGIVRVEATVDADGHVVDVKTISGNHMLSPAAEEAVRKWRYATAAGSSTIVVEINFAQ